ncbi:MAG TPA: hypothetical protein VES60_16765 [Nakamurella sp.]|nr:hypothetical protein [Nakamurella sp.]
MSGRSKRRHGDSPVVDVADVFADDALIDALVSQRGESVSTGTGLGAAGFGAAAFSATGVSGRGVGAAGLGATGVSGQGVGGKEVGGQGVGDGTLGGDPLIELFDIWRDEISSTPLPPVPAIRQASRAVAAGRHRQQRTARPAMFIAAAICALLIGSAAVGSRTAVPGDTLWALASVLWSDRLDSVHSLKEVKDALVEVQVALDAGRPDDAREALMRATVQLGHVDDLDMPASMPDKVEKLWVDVIPEAERRSTQPAASAAAAAADQTTAQPAVSPSPLSAAAGTPSASTPLLGTILEVIIASNRPPVSTDSSPTPSNGPSVPVEPVWFLPIAGPSTPVAVTDRPMEAPTEPKTDAPTKSAPPVTPTPPPVTTEPAPETSAAVPVGPTTGTTSSSDQTSTENSAPAPPPPSTEPSTDAPASSADTSTPAYPGSSDPAAATP